MLNARTFALLAALALALPQIALAAEEVEAPREVVYTPTPDAPRGQRPPEAARKSAGCKSCHTATDSDNMHQSPAVVLGCTDCHGGDASVRAPAAGAASGAGGGDEEGGEEGGHAYDPAYRAAMDAAHVQPTLPETWHYPSSANPRGSYTLLNRESPEYVRFVNPSDLRVAREACGACHLQIIQAMERHLMSTGAMLWGGAAYNNGILPFKNYILGESFTREGEAATILSPLEPDERMKRRGILPSLVPLPPWEVVPAGDIFRVFERGGRNILNIFPEIALPNSTGLLQRLEEPGRPDLKQSNRGPGTGLRVSIPVLNIHKTRLNDPLLWFLGTNDNPGDYRTSGCGACHVVYANDRNPVSSGPYAVLGHEGMTQTVDPTIPKDEPGHPLKHSFTNAIPSSQCMICHMHQPNVFVNSYLGFTMWDYESDAPFMWPEEQRYPTSAEIRAINDRNPEEAAIRGLWSDPEFVKRVSELNPELKNTQFADYHGHGWNFRAVFKKDRRGNLLDAEGDIVSHDDPDKFKKAVHMMSIHAEVGMQCVDCHFAQDAHGNGWIYGEVANSIEIDCVDCHGTTDKYPSLLTSGPAAPPGGYDLSLMRMSDGRRRFEWREGKLYQRSAVWPDREWEMSLVKDSVDPDHAGYNAQAARAKLMSEGTSLAWGPGVAPEDLAHKNEDMMCFTCHLSWTTSCAGCHLPIQANWKSPTHQYEGKVTRNYATYNPQVVRDQMFQLGIHSTVKGNKIVPVRSTSALVLSSQNINRERIYIQQPPIAASGFSSQAFAPHFPHTVRKTETKTCTDCHLSAAEDNNAIMAQLLLQGTNFVNLVGVNAWVGGEGGFEAVRVTEFDEPQAVIGSYLQRYAYPDWYAEHQERGRALFESYTQRSSRVSCLQLRGEYLFAAEGRGGFRAYDVASIANKGISDRIITAPFGPLGHDTHVGSKNATCMLLPTNQNIHPARNQGDLMRIDNQEQPFHPIYNHAFITDSEEGLIVVDVNTLADGEARNNFFERALTWNENGILDGARHIVNGGYYLYIAADAGIVVLNLDDPLAPKLEAVVPLEDVRAAALQFRYLFVTDRTGLRVIDVTYPERPRLVEGAHVALEDGQRIYLARTYAYVAAKRQGLAIIDIERPEAPALYTFFTAEGQIADARDVIVGSTNASLFAYVADGAAGLKVIQLTSPESQPRYYGYSPEPKPELIAWYRTARPAIALSKGLDRDRAVDETGGQIAVFGRLGSRPFTQAEMQNLYLDEGGNPWRVTDEVRVEDFVPAAAEDQREARAD